MDSKPVVLKEERSAGSFLRLPNFNFKIILAVLLVIFLIASVGVGVYLTKYPFPFRPKASGNANLSFAPSQISAAAQSQFTVNVAIDSPDLSVTGASLHIQWDPQYMNLTNFTHGDFLNSSLEQQATINSGTAFLTVIPSPLAGKKGSGNIASLTFTTLKTTDSGPTQVTIDTTTTKVTATEVTTASILGTVSPLAVTITAVGTGPSPSPSSSTLVCDGNIQNPRVCPTGYTCQSSSGQPVGDVGGTCVPNASPSPTASSGPSTNYDFNGDGKVNAVDLSIMYSGWGTPQTDRQKKADLNGDGVVNGQDYDTFITHFNL